MTSVTLSCIPSGYIIAARGEPSEVVLDVQYRHPEAAAEAAAQRWLALWRQHNPGLLRPLPPCHTLTNGPQAILEPRGLPCSP